MAYEPQTHLKLLAVPLQSDYSHTLYFEDADSQHSYFEGKIVDGGDISDKFNFIKKEHYVRVEGNIDKLFIANYMMYQNELFGTKWFYCFIDRLEWASQNSTNIYFHTDCIQTWMFDINWYDCYVIRAHQDTDEVGDNIVPEDIQLANGGYWQIGYKPYEPTGISYFATCDSSGNANSGEYVSGMFSGAKEYTGTSGLSTYVTNGLATAVSRVQQYPSDLAGEGGAENEFPKYPTTVGAYQPKNKKILTGACLTAFLSAYGQELEFNPDFCSGDSIKLKFVCDKTTGTVTCFVTNYDYGGSESRDYGISTISMSFQIPESQWAYSQYQNDYNLHAGSNSMKETRMKGQRSINKWKNSANLVGSVGGTVGGVLDVATLGITSGGVGKALSSTFSNLGNAYQGIGNVINDIRGTDEISQDLAYIQESLNAPATGGLTQAGPYIVGKMTRFSWGYKIPPQDMVERYDQYLTVYGYKQSKYMKPNFHARSNWTYIQCGMVNADGKFPQDDLNQVKAALMNGVFFWDKDVTFGDFSQDNTPTGGSSS